MIAKKQIPPYSGDLLSKLVQYERSNIFFAHDEWKLVGNNKRGGLKLALIIVYMKYDVTATNDRRKYNGLYQPMIGVWFYSPPSIVCLKDHFGVSKDTRLYFSPHQFPTPTDLNHGDICVSFFRLKKYIIECSMKEGEVACNSGGKMGKSKRFSCKTKHCKFCLTLKWDRFGYYIDHCIPGSGTTIGCLVHNH